MALSPDARTVLRTFVEMKTHSLHLAALNGNSGIYAGRLDAATSELEDAGFLQIENRQRTTFYKLTIEGWTSLGSPRQVVFPELD